VTAPLTWEYKEPQVYLYDKGKGTLEGLGKVVAQKLLKWETNRGRLLDGGGELIVEVSPEKDDWWGGGGVKIIKKYCNQDKNREILKLVGKKNHFSFKKCSLSPQRGLLDYMKKRSCQKGNEQISSEGKSRLTL